MLEDLKRRVYEQNIALVKYGLVVLTWGNVSAKDVESGLVVIKPSGVPYSDMRAEDMVVTDLDGNIIEGRLRPSSDLPTHLYLYKKYPSLGGVVHTHSTYATAFAQAGKTIKTYGTTHADVFYGDVPCTRALTEEEVKNDYEENTGKVISEYINDTSKMPAVLVKCHGVFTYGSSPEAAVEYAITLEEVAKMAYLTEGLSSDIQRVDKYLSDKHYYRKHGKNAYYGQNDK